jgi:hypothetical protein
MKRKLSSLLVTLTIGLSLNAQLPNGSVAPNWTATDINGTVHQLYEYLNADKIVILDFSATWCGPCWNYHNSAAMKNFYNQYGPNGTNQAMVIFLEGDTRTNTACLYGPTGCNFTTMGNWVAGTPYPIIDLPNGTISGAYRVAFFPTIYGIYPNRMLTELGQVNLTGFVNYLNSAPAPATEEYEVRILNYEGPTQACQGEGVVGVRVQNYGINPIQTIDFEVWDETEENLLLEYTWTGNMSKYDLRTITFGGFEILEEMEVVIKAKTENQEVFANSSLKVVLLPSPEIAAYRSVRVEVTTDNNASQTSWEMRDGLGNVIFTNGELENNKKYSRLYFVQEGECYLFSIFDSGGNGLQGDGFYHVFDNQNKTIAQGKNFGFAATHGFSGTRLLSSVSEIEAIEDIKIFPNPVSSVLQVDFNLLNNLNLRYQIMDEKGQVIMNSGLQTYFNGVNSLVIPVDQLVPGQYFLQFQYEDQNTTKPFIKIN